LIVCMFGCPFQLLLMTAFPTKRARTVPAEFKECLCSRKALIEVLPCFAQEVSESAGPRKSTMNFGSHEVTVVDRDLGRVRDLLLSTPRGARARP